MSVSCQNRAIFTETPCAISAESEKSSTPVSNTCRKKLQDGSTAKINVRRSPSAYQFGGRIMRSMTRARTRTDGVVTPPPIQLLLEVALCPFVSLMQGVASTLQLIFNRSTGDWQTHDAKAELPRETSDISHEGTTARFPPSVQSAGGVRLDPSSGPIRKANAEMTAKAGSSRLCDETEGAVIASYSMSLSCRAKARRAVDPEPSGGTRDNHHTQTLASGSRAVRTSGMIPLVCSSIYAK